VIIPEKSPVALLRRFARRCCDTHSRRMSIKISNIARLGAAKLFIGFTNDFPSFARHEVAHGLKVFLVCDVVDLCIISIITLN